MNALKRSVLLMLLSPALALAEPWQIDHTRSSLKFQAVQQDAAFTGEFPEFSAEIELDPDAPDLGLKIVASVSMGAVDTAYEERDEYLRSDAFFHASAYPVARFESTGTVASEDGVTVSGELTIKDDTHAISMHFSYDNRQSRLQGQGEISRLRFSVGTGMWEDTTWIADNVKVLVDLFLETRPEP